MQMPVKILDYNKIDEYIHVGYVVYLNSENQKCVAISKYSDSVIPTQYAKQHNLPVDIISTQDFYYLLEQNFKRVTTIKAKYSLQLLHENITAKTLPYKKILSQCFTLLVIILLINKNFFYLWCNFLYMLQNFFKIFLFHTRSDEHDFAFKSEFKTNFEYGLPVYTILIPLYKEEKAIYSIIKQIQNLNYDKTKLDVKIILEEDDKITIDHLNNIDIPEYFHVVKVPFSNPRTKPKALNYAMQYARGDYIVVYDAEDVPDKDQLLEALNLFKSLPDNYACLQAKLNFYNANQNFLTQLFSIEYTLWFEYILQTLALSDMPVGLGGTSNHFKADILRSIGGWDAYNVTEDADVGIRLYSHGYKVHILDSYTMEEGVGNLGIWIKQRSRWIKGFFQTFLVFLARSIKSRLRLNIKQKFSVCVFTGVSSISFLCMPWMVLCAYTTNSNQWIWYFTMINCALGFYQIYSAFFDIILFRPLKIVALKKLPGMIGIITLWPLYFLLHTIAAYIALFELCLKPFVWHKTPHKLNLDKK